MAEKASADRVAADMQPANYRSAVQLIRHAIQKKKEKIAGINGEIADQWAKVEGHKVNKKAGRIFATLDKLEHEERLDIMRSLNGLIDAAGWEETASDLVDAAQGNVVPLRVGGAKDDDPADPEREMDDLEKDLEAPVEAAKPRRGRKAASEEQAEADRGVARSVEDAKARTRAHFGQPVDGGEE